MTGPVVVLVHWIAITSATVSAANLRLTAAHPVHSTYTEISYTPATRGVEVTVRVFNDDFEMASRAGKARLAPGEPPEAARLRYLNSTFVLRDRDGRRVALSVERSWRTGDLYWIRLRGRLNAGLEGGTLRNTLLFELFNDQVNVVKLAKGRGATVSLLFLPGGADKKLR